MQVNIPTSDKTFENCFMSFVVLIIILTTLTQNELESFTEKLSEMVARPYLRTPRSSIIDMTLKVRRKRHEFMRAVSKGLVCRNSIASFLCTIIVSIEFI